MLFFKREEDMPFGEVQVDGTKNTVHHLNCNGSRRHVLWYDSHGTHCNVKNCEINFPGREGV